MVLDGMSLTSRRNNIIAVIKMQTELDLERRCWGGRRAGAGRARTRSEPSHGRRPWVSAHRPWHVVLRVRPEVARLRRRNVFEAARRALRLALGRGDFRIVHISIQHNHIHLLVEAEFRESLSKGMQGFAITLARAINRAQRRRGKVFQFRYHATEIGTPTQARHALAYVLNNWRRHREDASGGPIDRYSSAVWFHGWAGAPSFRMPAGWQPLPVANPQTWLFVVGWRAEGELDMYARPGSASG